MYTYEHILVLLNSVAACVPSSAGGLETFVQYYVIVYHSILCYIIV